MKLRALSIAFLILLGPAAIRGEAQPGTGRTGPCLILHDWFGKSPGASPAFIRDNLEFLESQPFDGLAVYVRSQDVALNVSGSVLSGTALSYEKIAQCLKPMARLPFKTLLHNFAAVVSQRVPDVFDENWTTIVSNFEALAKASREAGLKGIYFDNEMYGAKWANYPKGVANPEKSLEEYQAQALLRGRQAMKAMTAVFPDIQVITLHGPYVSEPKAPSPLFPTWHMANKLLGPFFAGFVEGCGDKAKCVDGGELYHLRSPEEFQKSYEWRKRTIASDRVNCAYLSAPVRARWAERVDVAFGVYDKPFGGAAMDPSALRTAIQNALRQTDRYVWFYVEGPTFLLPPEKGGASAEWVEAVRQGRMQAQPPPPRKPPK